MKIIILGASGIIGQHMRLCLPAGVEPIYTRRHSDVLHVGLDCNDFNAVVNLLLEEKPDAVVNLAGENSTDIVEQNPERYNYLNAVFPGQLLEVCRRQNIHLVHVSSQAVFSGDHPPYHAKSPRLPVNRYGQQKLEAEQRIEQTSSGWTIVRPTFVLGIRSIPTIGRENPLESIYRGQQTSQVDDRFFSVSLAKHVAETLWAITQNEPQVRAVQVGIPERISRYELAKLAGADVEPVAHESFPGLAPRPKDTTYSVAESWSATDMAMLTMEFLRETKALYEDRDQIGLKQRARELSIFTGKPEFECLDRLKRGFHANHHAVAEDFRRFDPKSDGDLLKWYRQTDAYLWELSAYHADAGFNYTGMCQGAVDRLKAAGAKSVLCLGDGIGDLTLTLLQNGFDAAYHDLAGSRTADFAMMRLWMYLGHHGNVFCTGSFRPLEGFENTCDAICSFDFMEHLPNVEEWVRMVHQFLKPGGLFFVQNAFNCGSGPDGSIPMHLTINDHFEKDWDPMLEAMGFVKLSNNWYQKPGEKAQTAEPYESVAAV